MEAIKELEENIQNKNSRIKQNVRIISASSKLKQRLRRLSSKSGVSDNRDSPAYISRENSDHFEIDDSNKKPTKYDLPPEIENLKKLIVRRASTMPDLFNTYDLKAVYEETKLRKQFRDAIGVRNHSSPHANKPNDISSRWKSAYNQLNVSQLNVSDALESLTEKEEKLFADYLSSQNCDTGLWKMAYSTAYEYKASKTHNVEDLAMAILTKKMAVKKMRQKIARKLELPTDKFTRIATLRQNVSFIEQKFENMKQVKPKITDALKNIVSTYGEVVDNDLPSRFTKPGEAKTYFRKFGRIVLIILSWIFLIMDGSETSKLERELKSFVDIAQEAVEKETSSQAMAEQGLSFDKKVYKANREISLTVEHRKILTTRWNFRTPDMIKQVMHGLQALRSLADYPLRTQERLCQVAWYQTIGPKKVILRQGHNAESFYFILSGTAFVKRFVRNDKTGESKVQVAARLTKGHSFGEVGLIFNTKRTATVESTTPMELLVIGKEDFNAIFMKADDQDEESEHVRFLRQVPIMSQWPVDCLKTEPGTCVLHYFKRGNLITADSSTSEWLYIVKSGTCEVMKELKAAKARKCGQSYIRPDPVSDIFLPELGMGASPRINTGISHKRKFVMTPEIFEEMSQYYDKLKQKLKEIKRGEQQARDRQKQLENDRKKTETPALPRLSINSQLIRTKEESDDGSTVTSSIKSPEILSVPPVYSMKQDGSKGVSSSTFNEKMLSMMKMKAHIMFPTASMIEKEAPVKKTSSESDENSPRKNSVFVHVQLLQPKDIFGLNTLSSWGSEEIQDNLNEAPPMCLVSRGAEIIMLSKKIFLKYTNDRVKKLLRENLRPYPSESKLQDNFQTKVDWESYKSSLLEDIIKHQYSLKSISGLV